MENISKVLAGWGSWIADNQEIVNLLSGNKRDVIPERIRLRKKCCHHKAIIINELMSILREHSREEYQLLIDYYVFGKTFIQLAKYESCSDTYIGKKIKKAEGIVEGMLLFSSLN
ncbi:MULTISPECIES: antiterminator Q family protein [Gammaproteobacteria]|uniref:antiterminator Q family protein n=1 Tax=Gammaproteobacteria TaxID=1236 RepID=UPI001D005B25|nr:MULTISPECIES: antiterminator Q family protein [Gammaproteobacteria]